MQSLGLGRIRNGCRNVKVICNNVIEQTFQSLSRSLLNEISIYETGEYRGSIKVTNFSHERDVFEIRGKFSES